MTASATTSPLLAYLFANASGRIERDGPDHVRITWDTLPLPTVARARLAGFDGGKVRLVFEAVEER